MAGHLKQEDGLLKKMTKHDVAPWKLTPDPLKKMRFIG